MKKFFIILTVFALVNCAASVRTQYSNGEDNKEKVTRIVVPIGLAVLSVNSVKPSMSQIFDNRNPQSNMTKNFNLLPGKHVLEVAFKRGDIESKSNQNLNLEVKAGELYFICFEKNPTSWKPTALLLTKDQYEEVEIMGGYNYAIKTTGDSRKCYPN